MKATKRKRLARIFHGSLVESDRKRFCIVELHGDAGTVAVRLEGCRTRKTYKAADLYTGQLVKPQLTIKSNQLVEFRGKSRRIVADIDSATGQITVRPDGIHKGKKALKTYNLADLFTWGPQLQLL